MWNEEKSIVIFPLAIYREIYARHIQPLAISLALASSYAKWRTWRWTAHSHKCLIGKFYFSYFILFCLVNFRVIKFYFWAFGLTHILLRRLFFVLLLFFPHSMLCQFERFSCTICAVAMSVLGRTAAQKAHRANERHTKCHNNAHFIFSEWQLDWFHAISEHGALYIFSSDSWVSDCTALSVFGPHTQAVVAVSFWTVTPRLRPSAMQLKN